MSLAGNSTATVPTTATSGTSAAAASTNGAASAAAATGSTPVAIYDQNIHRTKHSIPLTSLQYIFVMIIKTAISSSKTSFEIESKLNTLGYSIGFKYYQLEMNKTNSTVRFINQIDLLKYLISDFWIKIFNYQVQLEKSLNDSHTYLIIDPYSLMTSNFGIEEGVEFENFMAGFLESILDLNCFKCQVTAHRRNQGKECVYLVKFYE